MMKKVFQQMCLALTVMVVVVACSSDDNYSASGVKEGLPVSLKLTLGVPDPAETKMTRATDVVETRVEKLALVFYRKTFPDSLPVVIEVTSDKLGEPKQISTTNYQYTVSFTTKEIATLTKGQGANGEGLVSGDWYLYGIANYDKGYVSVTLDDIKAMTKAEMDEYCTNGSQDQDIVETAVLQSGKYGYDSQTRRYSDGSLTLVADEVNDLGENGTLLVLRRTVAKNIFEFVNGDGVEFVPTSYELHNYSTSSTLMEDESLWQTDKTATPIATASRKAKDNTLLSKANIYIAAPSSTTDNYTFSFYTQENVQHAKSTPDSGWTYVERDRHNHQEGETERNFTYAPDGGTYVVVKGNYAGPGKKNKDGTYSNTVTGEVSYTIHLGDFSEEDYSNFSVRRNTKYTYKVTVKSVNSIIVECTSEDETQPGAEGEITANADDATSLTLDAHYEQVLLPLDVSRLSDYELSVKTPYTKKTFTTSSDFSDEDDYEWVMFGRPASQTSFQTYQAVKSSGLINIKQLLDELKSPSSSSSYYIYDERNGKIYVAAYIDEYYYSDKELSTFVNADNREMTLNYATSRSKDGHSSYTESPIFSLKQRSIKSPFNLNLDNPFGVETVEESPAKAINSSNSDTFSGSNKIDGYGNYARNFSVGSASWNFSVGSASWSTYINEHYNGYIDGKFGGTDGVGAVMKNGYNYAYYHCLMRNRDIDGNGTIDRDELRWYLPAHNQCLYLWFGNNSIPSEARISEEHNCNYLTSTNGAFRVWWAAEGSSFGTYDNSYKSCKVRAVRSLKSITAATTPIATYDAKTRVVTVSGLSSSSMRLTAMSGNYDVHGRGEAPDKLPQAFKIATSPLSGVFTGEQLTTSQSTGASYSEATDGSDAGQWRVPNEKELALMYMFLGTDLANGTGARSTYLLDKNTPTRYYYINGCVTTGTAKNDNFYIRLVKDN